MNNYDFSSINDKEFEELVRELLNRKYGWNLQSFAAGPDKGIDLRYSTAKNINELIVQAKHFLHSDYAKLKAIIKNKELPKIRKLHPRRYILVTSQPMTVHRQQELKGILEPYIATAADIIGREELNKYLVEYDDLEIKYFKLWFSSVPILRAILNNAIEGRSANLLSDLASKGKLYVVTQKLDQAKKLLLKEKLLVVTGEPGIGKTTIASMLLLERARNNCKVYQVETIREAEDVFSMDDEEKQVFYFDDFLGATQAEIINMNRKETQLTSFVERVRNTPNKFLIVTSRTVILNQALEAYEKIARAGLGEEKFEIRLSDYTKYEKALILYNHFYFRSVEERYYEAVVHNAFYKTIVNHPNYTPRTMEFITENKKIAGFSAEQYRQFILNNLQNPKQIWRYSFYNQIGHMERCLLLTLFTFEGAVQEKMLLSAFESRQAVEKTIYNQVLQAGQFDKSVKILLDGFITIVMPDSNTGIRYYSFVNPSLGDFFIGLMTESFSEKKAVILSVRYYEQLKKFHPAGFSLTLEPELQELIKDKIDENSLILNKTSLIKTDMNRLSTILLDMVWYCCDIEADKVCLDCLLESDFSKMDDWDAHRLISFMSAIPQWPKSRLFLADKFEAIISQIIQENDDHAKALEIPGLFSKFQKDFTAFATSECGKELLVEMINKILGNHDQSIVDELKKTTDIGEVESSYDALWREETELKEQLLPDHEYIEIYNTALDYDYWTDIVEDNAKAEDAYQDDDDHHYYNRDSDRQISIDPDAAIDDLFRR